MYRNRTIMALIPARGGSKGLPRKNILPISGKPLIVWTIERALSSRLLDKVIVSTDDSEIAEISRQYGVEVPFMRPPELAGDTTSMMDVLFHAINFFKGNEIFFDYVALLEPTSPLRKADDIDKAITQLINHENMADSLVSMGDIHLEHPLIMKRIIGEYVYPYEDSAKLISRRQELDKIFFPYGVIYLARTNKLIEYKTFYQERTIPYFIERWQNYEVDDIYDLICIEAITNYRRKREW
jgi:CMP-N,N'-diacetyllegionaminic acid synthase